MIKPSSVSWYQTSSKGDNEVVEYSSVEEQNNRRNYYPLNNQSELENNIDTQSTDEKNKSLELPVTMDIQEQNSADTTSKTPEELSLVNPEKLAYILIGVCCGLSILCLIIVAISIGYNKSETQYRFSSGGGGGVKVSKSIKLIKASSSDMKSNSSTSSGSSGSTSEAEEVDTEGQHSLQVVPV
jgi:hypothetical protein